MLGSERKDRRYDHSRQWSRPFPTIPHWTPRGMHAYVYTPRRQHVLFPRSKPQLTFSPAISAERYVAPPPPPPLKRPPPPKSSTASKDELRDAAQRLRVEARELEKSAAVTSGPALGIQLGLMLLTREDYIKQIEKAWDPKGKGELTKADFRLHLRNTGLQATSAEADKLFDSWDEDRDGSLDMKVLKAALVKVQIKARQWETEQKKDTRMARVKAIREHAELADAAATAVEQAEVSSADPCPCIRLLRPFAYPSVAVHYTARHSRQTIWPTCENWNRGQMYS